MTEQDLAQLPKTRKAAIECGGKYYFTGEPCKHGHIDKRTVLRNDCFFCSKERSIRWAQNNKELAKERSRHCSKKWYHENKHNLDKSKKKEYFIGWYQENKDSVKKQAAEWRLNNPEKTKMARIKSEAKRRAIEGFFLADDIKSIGDKQRWKCASCYEGVGKKYHVDHIMPIKLGGTNWPENIQILCPMCNLRKSAKHPLTWAQENGRFL